MKSINPTWFATLPTSRYLTTILKRLSHWTCWNIWNAARQFRPCKNGLACFAKEGTIDIRVHNLFDMFELLASPDRRSNENAEQVIQLIFGSQAYVGDYHLAGFTASLLSEYLSKAGLLVCKAELMHDWLFVVTARKADRLVDPVELVHSAYFKILNRPADESGIVTFSRMIAAGKLSQAQLEDMLADSDEARFLATNPFYLRRHKDRLAPLTTLPGHFLEPALESRARRPAAHFVTTFPRVARDGTFEDRSFDFGLPRDRPGNLLCGARARWRGSEVPIKSVDLGQPTLAPDRRGWCILRLQRINLIPVPLRVHPGPGVLARSPGFRPQSSSWPCPDAATG